MIRIARGIWSFLFNFGRSNWACIDFLISKCGWQILVCSNWQGMANCVPVSKCTINIMLELFRCSDCHVLTAPTWWQMFCPAGMNSLVLRIYSTVSHHWKSHPFIFTVQLRFLEFSGEIGYVWECRVRMINEIKYNKLVCIEDNWYSCRWSG